ncbi:MAG: DUF456 domain-containing protein [Phycicoccus sp.]|nr:DUF456 domain-containing protein [Phycicoccus sp.]
MPAGTEVWVAALIIVVGILGIAIPVLPGLLICVIGVLVWSASVGTVGAWTVFSLCVALAVAGWVIQFLVPGKRLKSQGVGTSTLLVALVVAIAGFFIIPVVGAPIGFVVGILAVELLRSRDLALAWTRTWSALKAVLMSWGIEITAGLMILLTWIVGVVVTSSV